MRFLIACLTLATAAGSLLATPASALDRAVTATEGYSKLKTAKNIAEYAPDIILTLSKTWKIQRACKVTEHHLRLLNAAYAEDGSAAQQMWLKYLNCCVNNAVIGSASALSKGLAFMSAFKFSSGTAAAQVKIAEFFANEIADQKLESQFKTIVETLEPGLKDQARICVPIASYEALIRNSGDAR